MAPSVFDALRILVYAAQARSIHTFDFIDLRKQNKQHAPVTFLLLFTRYKTLLPSILKMSEPEALVRQVAEQHLSDTDSSSEEEPLVEPNVQDGEEVFEPEDVDPELDSDSEDDENKIDELEEGIEWETSKYRGPGEINSAEAAKGLRQAASQNHTNFKKQRFQNKLKSKVGVSYRDVVTTLVGEAGVKAAYAGARHGMTKRGHPMGEQATIATAVMFDGEDKVEKLEEWMSEEVDKKWQVKPKKADRGKNWSGAMNKDKALLTALKSELKDLNICAQRGNVLATTGVTMINYFQQNLKAANNGVDVTQDQVKAGMQMALYYGWANKSKAPDDYTPVNGDMKKKKRRRVTVEWTDDEEE